MCPVQFMYLENKGVILELPFSSGRYKRCVYSQKEPMFCYEVSSRKYILLDMEVNKGLCIDCFDSDSHSK